MTTTTQQRDDKKQHDKNKKRHDSPIYSGVQTYNTIPSTILVERPKRRYPNLKKYFRIIKKTFITEALLSHNINCSFGIRRKLFRLYGLNEY